MLSLQGAVILLNHQTGHIAHHLLIAFHLTLALEALVEDEVVVTFKRMTVDAGIGVAMVGNELLQFDRCFGQILDVESHIFDET